LEWVHRPFRPSAAIQRKKPKNDRMRTTATMTMIHPMMPMSPTHSEFSEHSIPY
jgi:hypothetical protein